MMLLVTPIRSSRFRSSMARSGAAVLLLSYFPDRWIYRQWGTSSAHAECVLSVQDAHRFGGAFCGDCQQQVSLDFGRPPRRDWATRLTWVALGQVLAVVVWMLPLTVDVSFVFGMVSGLGLVAWLMLAFYFPYALYKDLVDLRQREDVDWTPSVLVIGLLLTLCVPLVTQPLVAAGYRWVRPQPVAE